MKKQIATLAILCTLLTSCEITRNTVGQGPQGNESGKTFSTGNQVWLFWGLAPLNNPVLKTPADNNFQFMTKTRFLDGFIKYVTYGIVIVRHEEVRTK